MTKAKSFILTNVSNKNSPYHEWFQGTEIMEVTSLWHLHPRSPFTLSKLPHALYNTQPWVNFTAPGLYNLWYLFV